MRISKPIAYLLLSLTLLAGISTSQAQSDALLSVKQIMTAIIAPMTATIWGAYQLEGDAQWQEIENAALSVIAAGNLLQQDSIASQAQQQDWQQHNAKMIAAARQVLTAVANQDEEALFNAGNDALYPPCESCHQRYQQR